jgi:hypothetical protein
VGVEHFHGIFSRSGGARRAQVPLTSRAKPVLVKGYGRLCGCGAASAKASPAIAKKMQLFSRAIAII